MNPSLTIMLIVAFSFLSLDKPEEHIIIQQLMIHASSQNMGKWLDDQYTAYQAWGILILGCVIQVWFLLQWEYNSDRCQITMMIIQTKNQLQFFSIEIWYHSKGQTWNKNFLFYLEYGLKHILLDLPNLMPKFIILPGASKSSWFFPIESWCFWWIWEDCDK